MKKIILLVSILGMHVGNLCTMSPAQVLEKLRGIDETTQEARQKLQKKITDQEELLVLFSILEDGPQSKLDSFKEYFLKDVASGIIEEIATDIRNDAQRMRNLKEQQDGLEGMGSKELVQKFIKHTEDIIKSATEQLEFADSIKNMVRTAFYAQCRGKRSVKEFDIIIFDQMCKEDKEKRAKQIEESTLRFMVFRLRPSRERMVKQYMQEENASLADAQKAIELAKSANDEELQKLTADGKERDRILKAVREYMVNA